MNLKYITLGMPFSCLFCFFSLFWQRISQISVGTFRKGVKILQNDGLNLTTDSLELPVDHLINFVRITG